MNCCSASARFADYRLSIRVGRGGWAIDLPDGGSIKLAGVLSVCDTDEIVLLIVKGQSVARGDALRVEPVDPTG